MQPKFLILVVDDDSSLLYVLNSASRLSFPEASFIQVHSVTEAITYIHELDNYGPKLILLDLDLGSSKSGLDLIVFLQSHAQGRFLPVIMLTIDQLPTTITTSYLAGVSSFTVKPFDFEEWKSYFAVLRLYWFSTVTIPPIRFHKLEYWK
jgi:CheY-like chemotaxis protein